jgi:hypothetical protein
MRRIRPCRVAVLSVTIQHFGYHYSVSMLCRSTALHSHLSPPPNSYIVARTSVQRTHSYSTGKQAPQRCICINRQPNPPAGIILTPTHSPSLQQVTHTPSTAPNRTTPRPHTARSAPRLDQPRSTQAGPSLLPPQSTPHTLPSLIPTSQLQLHTAAHPLLLDTMLVLLANW